VDSPDCPVNAIVSVLMHSISEKCHALKTSEVWPLKANEIDIKKFTYEGIDALNNKKLFERVIPPAQTPPPNLPPLKSKRFFALKPLVKQSRQ